MTTDEAPDETVGRLLAGRYRVDAPIARGGMSRVYRARDTRLERDVAIKILSDRYAADPEFVTNFLAEARAAASLSHPSLVHVYDSGSDGAEHFIVMELLDRHRSLREAVDTDGPLHAPDVLRIGHELLAGLRVVHARGLVHCDVKSGNVMLGPGPAKLIDFGIARPPHQALPGDTSIGSLQFMSPEQLRGEALTPASDLFSLGVVLYEALTGRMPYPGRTPEAVVEAHAAGRVTPPSAVATGVPERLDAVVMQALRPDPASRFVSADAMSRALDAAGRDVETGNTDETRVVDLTPPPARPPERMERAGHGYVPPPVDARRGPPPPRRRATPPRQQQRRSRRRAGIGGLIGTLLILGAVALVVAFVILPLMDLGGTGGEQDPGTTPSARPSSTPGPTAQPGTVLIPDTVGRPTQEGIRIATGAGLNWRLECAEDPNQPEGIIGQEPRAGTSVAPGSRFTMFSARISDCR